MENRKLLFCVSSSKKWYSGFLRWLLKSPVHHCFLIYHSDEWRGDMAIEIASEGPRIISVKQLLDKQVYIEAYQCKLDVWPAVVSMRDEIGAHYDFLGLFWNIFRLILYGIFRLQILKPLHFISNWFCSEFCSEILIRSGFPGTEGWKSSDISPSDLRKFYSKSDHFEYVFYPSS